MWAGRGARRLAQPPSRPSICPVSLSCSPYWATLCLITPCQPQPQGNLRPPPIHAATWQRATPATAHSTRGRALTAHYLGREPQASCTAPLRRETHIQRLAFVLPSPFFSPASSFALSSPCICITFLLPSVRPLTLPVSGPAFLFWLLYLRPVCTVSSFLHRVGSNFFFFWLVRHSHTHTPWSLDL